MTMPDTAREPEKVGQPAPKGEAVSLVSLGFGVIAAPLVWLLGLTGAYAVASHACFAGSMPRFMGGPSHSAWLALIAIVAVALVICLAGGAVAYRAWQATKEPPSHPTALVEIGEGRSQFLAVWGVLTSALFVIPVALFLLALALVPLCGY